MIFVDTGAFIGRYVAADQHHEAAASAWRDVLARRRTLFSSNFVIDETATNLARIVSYDFAAGIARGLLSDSRLRILRPGRAEELNAVRLFTKYADQEVSFTDCVSFVLMRAGKIKRAFTFDRHFAAAGFEVVP